MAQGVETFEAAEKTIITATTLIKTTRGKVARVLVVAGTGQIDVYDTAAADTSNQVFSKAVTAVGDIYALNCPLNSGLRVVMAGAGQLCVTYS